MYLITSDIEVSYGVFRNTGGLSFISDIRTIIGIFFFLLDERMVQIIYSLEVNVKCFLFSFFKLMLCSLNLLQLTYLKNNMAEIIFIPI